MFTSRFRQYLCLGVFFVFLQLHFSAQNYQTNHFDNQWSFNRVTQSECLGNPYHTIVLGREEMPMNAPKCEAFEVDEFGQPVNAREYVTSANFPLEFLHIEPAFNGYIACGFTNNGSTTVRSKLHQNWLKSTLNMVGGLPEASCPLRI